MAAIFALIGAAIGLRPLTDNSLFTHIATGRLILESGIPHADPYSYTAPGTPWIVQSWLPSLLYGVLDRVAGGNGIRVLATVATALLAVLVWRLTRPAQTLVPRIAAGVLPLVIGSTFWVPRPLLFGLIAFAVVLWWIEEPFPSAWLVPLFYLWANSHGSFPLGLVLLAAVAVGRRLDGEVPRRELVGLGWALLGTVLAMIGPLGPEVLSFPVTLLGKREILQNVVEWKPPAWNQLWAQAFAIQVVLAVAALVRRRTYAHLLPMVVFTAAALLATRNVPVASLVLVPGTAYGLADLGRIRAEARTPLGVVLLSVAAVVGVVSGAVLLTRPAYDFTTYPEAAFDWLEQRDLLGPDVRLLTEDTNSNLLELRNGLSTPVFIDDRYDMFPMPVLRDYLTLHRVEDGWPDVLDRYGVDVVLWDRTTPFAKAVSEDPDWATAYQDDTWVVVCRRGSAAAARCGVG